MYFLFLTYEVKCGVTALNITDRQNAYSITLAVKSVIELFGLVKHKKELYQEIFAFLVSYDHQTVRIYGYYLIIDRKRTIFYRHLIHKFSFTALDSKEK